MRTIRFFIILVLAFPLCTLAQDAPQDQPPQSQDGQGAQRGNGQQWRGMGTGGTITAITDKSLTLKTRDGETAQVSLSDATRYRKGRDDAKFSDLKVGDMVFVRGQQKDGIWQAEVVAERPAGMGGPGMGGPGGANFRENLGKKFIMGEITAMNGTQLTIKRPDGVSQNITVDENTSFRKDNESVTLTDLKVGDHVFGRGDLKNDVFVPAQLNVGQPHFGGMHGQGQGQGGAQQQDSPQAQPPMQQK